MKIKNSIKLFIIYLLVFVFNTASAGEDLVNKVDNYWYVKNTLSDDVLGEISDISKKVMTTCRPPNCIVIGVGRSPTPIVSYLNLFNNKSALELPLSNFRYSPQVILRGEELIPRLSRKQEGKLFNYFNEFLMSKLGPEVEKVMLLDFTITGESLMSTKTYLDRFIKKQGEMILVEAFAVTTELRENKIKTAALDFSEPLPHTYVMNPNSPLVRAMEFEKFDGLAKYQKFNFLDKDYRGLPYPVQNSSSLRKEYLSYFREKLTGSSQKLSSKECLLFSEIFFRGRIKEFAGNPYYSGLID